MQRPQPFRVALLYDSEGSMHVGTIKEHVEAFLRYSAHCVLLLPATSGYWRHFGDAQRFDLSFVDAIIVHYSVRLSVPDHLDPCLAQAIASFPGLKMLFLQDEYENTETARAWMDRLAFDVVYTCVPEESLATVYPAFRFPATRFIQTLTGYVPEDPEIDRYGLPLAERKLLIGYRGRRLPAKYGQLGREKEQIGVEMRRVAEDRSFAVDIEVDDSKRIYGADWYRFLGSVRATLGTESGANLFDWVGELDARTKQQAAAHAAGKSDTGAPPMLEAEEGEIRMNQISPKVFEAIRLRTALVLFEGSYSGVVKPGVHYLPLKKDFSNVDEVLARLQDDAFLLAMTDRAYDDIIASGAYSYQRFVAGVDGEIRRRLVRVNPCAPILGPLMFRDATGVLKQGLPHYFLNINDMRRGLGEAAATMGREEWSMAGHLAGSDASENTSGRTPESTLTERAKAVGARIGRRLWPSVVAIGRKSWLSRWLPVDVKTRIFNWYRRFLDS